MLLSFTGEYPQKVDGKGRMSIPAGFRRVLEANDPDWAEGLPAKLYINYGAHLKQNLRIYSVKAMMKIDAQIQELDEGSELQILLNRLYLGQSEELSIDKDGRIVMPIRHREKLGMTEGEVTFMGLGNYFEVWKAETYSSAVTASLDALVERLAGGADPLSLIAKQKKTEGGA